MNIKHKHKKKLINNKFNIIATALKNENGNH